MVGLMDHSYQIQLALVNNRRLLRSGKEGIRKDNKICSFFKSDLKGLFKKLLRSIGLGEKS